MTKYRCVYCGKMVITDDEAQSILHEDPVCPEFDALMRSGNEQPEIRQIKDAAVQAHLAALRAQVKARGKS